MGTHGWLKRYGKRCRSNSPASIPTAHRPAWCRYGWFRSPCSADCQCHEDRLLTDDGPECGDFGYGICDAVSAWSDCNRAIGRIYRRDEDESVRDDGDTILVWVAPEQAALFEVVYGDR